MFFAVVDGSLPSDISSLQGASDVAPPASIDISSTESGRGTNRHPEEDQPDLDSTDNDDAKDTSDDTSEDTSSDYLSFEDSDDEEDHHLPEYPETKAEREARAHERQMVLEAAGLIVKTDPSRRPPPRPERRKSKSNKRRPAPAAPRTTRASIGNRDRASVISTGTAGSEKDLPSVPAAAAPALQREDSARPSSIISVAPSTRVDDAFDRYESFKQQHHPSRLSVSSITDMTTPTSPTSPTGGGERGSPNPASRDGESRYSNFMNFLGRSRTPVEGPSDKPGRPIISGPISGPIAMDNHQQRSQSPAFGSVRRLSTVSESSSSQTDWSEQNWASLVDRSVADELPPNERKRQEVHKLPPFMSSHL